MERKYEYERFRVDIPLRPGELKQLKTFLAVRGAGKGPYLRQLVLTAMDPATGPIVESAMRGRPAPDLSAGQAKETAAAIEKMGGPVTNEPDEDGGDIPFGRAAPEGCGLDADHEVVEDSEEDEPYDDEELEDEDDPFPSAYLGDVI